MKRTLIIGNGFDIDAGLKTSYSSFAGSEYWPFKDEQPIQNFPTLAFQLNKNARLETWFDVEETMFSHACKKQTGLTLGGQIIEKKDKEDFDTLKRQLSLYLGNEETNFKPNEKSVAMSLLRKIAPHEDQTTKNLCIYSFNYTNLDAIATCHGIYRNILCNNIHGSLQDNNIILGVGDKRDLRYDYFYMYKTSSPHFASHNIIPDMQDSDEVIIFGHSLGFNDYPYFMPFFSLQSSFNKFSKADRKKITFFTLNQESELQIKRHLRDLTGAETTALYALNDVKFYYTDGTKSSEIDTYIHSLI